MKLYLRREVEEVAAGKHGTLHAIQEKKKEKKAQAFQRKRTKMERKVKNMRKTTRIPKKEEAEHVHAFVPVKVKVKSDSGRDKDKEETHSEQCSCGLIIEVEEI